jgi:hypothetical protein
MARDNPPYSKGAQLIYPAGVPPKAWGNGKLIRYEKWNAYEVVFGAPIVHQQWGSGELNLQAGGKGLKIKVDPRTAKVSYYSFPGKVDNE